MPCFRPIQGFLSILPDGKRKFVPSNSNASLFFHGLKMPSDEDICSIPCGKCDGCRVEQSRQWAVRCMHESKLYDDNCFVTLTFSPEHLAKMCPDGSLRKKHVQDFMKRLRVRFSDRKIRVFYCGEYGERFERPHYHLCLFNLDFSDKKRFKRVGKFWYFTSEVLSSLWPFGHCTIGALSFDSAAYVARYCVKKVVGSDASLHYQGREREFACMSNRPGIGHGFYEKFKSDVYPSDEVIVAGRKCKPPRYYDKLLERDDVVLFDAIRARRRERALENVDDNSFKRLAVREKCHRARMKNLVRLMET